jgi:hypothetical protein
MTTNKIYKIDADILNESDKCARNFSCLFSNKGYCEIEKEFRDDGHIIFIKPSKNDDCTYMMPFGFSSFICNCPTRVAIYKKYGM